MRNLLFFTGAVLVALAILPLGVSTAHAQTLLSWTGANNAAWAAAGNWNPNNVPNASDEFISGANGNNVRVGGTYSFGGLGQASTPLNLAAPWVIFATNAGANSITMGVLNKSGSGLTLKDHTAGGTLAVTVNGDASLAGGVAFGDGTASLTSLTITGTTYVASQAVSLNVTGAADLGTLSNNATMNVAQFSGAGSARVVNVRGLTGGGTLQAASSNVYGGGFTHVLQINPVSGSYTYTGTLQDGAGTNNTTLALLKTGAGTQVLSGSSTFTGGTTLSNGMLRVNGVLSGTGGLTVCSNATLGGTGSVRGVTLANGGTLAPGNSIGTLTVSNLTLNTGSLFDFELAATNSSDKVMNLGTLTLAQLGFSNFTFTTNAGFGVGIYTLVDAALHDGSFSAVTNESFYGYVGTIFLGGNDGNDLLLSVAIPIPEPSVLAVLAGALGLLRLVGSRRRAPQG